MIAEESSAAIELAVGSMVEEIRKTLRTKCQIFQNDRKY